MAGNASFDQILSTTLKNYTPKIQDNFFGARPLLNWLKSKNRMKFKTGGEKIVEPIMYDDNDTATSYGEWDTLPTTPQEGISAAEYEWRQSAVSIAISGLQEDQNNGAEKVIDLLEAKITQAEESLFNLFSTMLYATSVTGDNWNSIDVLVDESGSGATVGGIDRSTETYWKAVEEAVGGPLTLSVLTSVWNEISGGTSQTPDGAFTTDDLWGKYESLLQPQQRFSDASVAQAGFDNLLYKGKCPVTWDPSCNADTWYFLNSKFIYLVGHKNTWFRTTPFKAPTNQEARYAQILVRGNLVSNQPRRLGKLTGATV